MIHAAKWLEQLPFDKDINFNDIPGKYFDWFIDKYEQKCFYSGKIWVKVVDNEMMNGFIKIKYKNRYNYEKRT